MRYLFLISVLVCSKAYGQCNIPSPFASSTWLDSTRGTITFDTTTMSGWSVTVFNQQRSTWECVDSSDSTTLVLKATTSISYSSSAIFIFMCMKLTQITTNSYSYKLQQVQQPNAGFERLWFSTDSGLSTVSTICDTSISIPTLEFHVLVKQGSADSAAITFPDKLLFSADYTYMTSTGTIDCNSTDTMDMCTDTTALSFNNYTNCQQQIAYSADGELWCVAKASLGSYDCAVVYNRDATISGTASQFACLCSDGSSVSVVSGNCTSDQTATSYPTAADGTTVIGYLLSIGTVYVNCAPTSDSSNMVVVIVIVVVLVILIAVVVVSIILYKRGHCVTICGHVDKCLDKTPCWPFCQSKVCVCCANKDKPEVEKPIMSNGTSVHVETVNETLKPKLTRDKTSMSAITRSSTMAITKEKSELEKSLLRQATTTSIGFDMKSERSSVHQIKIKSEDEDDKTEPRLKLLGLDLSFLVCCPKKKDEVKTVRLAEPEDDKPSSPDKKPKKGETKKGAIKSTKGGGKEGKVKGGKGKGKGAKGKDKGGKTSDKSEKEEGKAIENGKVEKEEKTDVIQTKEETTSDKVKGKADKGGKKNKNKAKVQPQDSPRNGDITLTDVESSAFPENEILTRAPTKMKSDLHLTSTPVPGGEKGQKGVVSVPAGLLKPKDKPTEWTFLSCCFGKRNPPPSEEEKIEDPAAPVIQVKGKIKSVSKGKGGVSKKGTTGAAKKPGKKSGGGKGSGKKKDVNENEVEKEEPINQPQPIERAKTMPEREKTTLSLQDAEHVKVAVYIPTDKTNLQLKDTVINGPPKLEKSKTDAGLVRPPSSRPASSVKQNDKKSHKKGIKKAEKGKSGNKKDKKSGKKKKK